MSKLHVIKIGGNLIEDTHQLNKVLSYFAALNEPKILVHGGGKKATEIATKLDVSSKMHQGRRITDQNTLEVATMVYAGLINKNIVAQLQALNVQALGMSGADGNLIQAVKRPVKEIDYGFAGDVVHINRSLINYLITANITIVCCAISHDKNGQLLNTNADTVASEIAIEASKDHEVLLSYCFEKKGVLESPENDDSVIEHINSEVLRNLNENKIISEGMLPKLHHAFNALKRGVDQVHIGSPEMITNPQYVRTILSL